MEEAFRTTREGIALCLSGGGFRSALFHLGALRRLRELGLLHQVALISSVSGGSILSGFLADRLARSASPDFETWLGGIDWERDLSAPFREITSFDFRTWPVLKNLAWNWFLPGPRMRDLERRYRARISRLKLSELPERPAFVFCATNLAFGVNWVFTRERAGDYQAGYLNDVSEWPLSRAIAASSAFPPIFGPLAIRADPAAFHGGRYRGEDRYRLLAKTALSDGGVYDNLGLEPAWKNYATVLVSDCGAPFEFTVGTNPIRRLVRYTSVVMNQAGSLRKRFFFYQRQKSAYSGTYWGIRSAAGKTTEVELASLPEEELEAEESARPALDISFAGYSRALVDGTIAEIRTDLDSFTEAEQKILENHGYFAANHSVTRYVKDPPPNEVPLRPPHPEWLDEDKVARALATSARRVSLSRCWRVFRERRRRKARASE